MQSAINEKNSQDEQNSSKWLNEKSWLLRLFWNFLHITLIITAAWIGVYYIVYLRPHKIVDVKDFSYDVGGEPFPGFAICNTNKISLRRAQSLVKNLSQNNLKVNTKKSANQIMDALRLFGFLLQFDVVPDLSPVKVFRKAIMFNSSFTILEQLATPCNELLVKCIWNNVGYRCEELFELEITGEGFCCVFKEMLSLVNVTSLSITVNNNEDDYLFTSEPMTGVDVYVYNPKPGGYLNLFAGEAAQFHLNQGTKFSMKIGASAIWKETVCNQEESYFYSTCITHCKAKHFKLKCKCVPLIASTLIEGVPVCSFEHLPCLQAYKNLIWRFVNGLNGEHAEVVACLDCLEKCKSLNYEVIVNNGDSSKNRKSNQSVIDVCVHQTRGLLYIEEFEYPWYLLIGNLGAIAYLFLGLSLPVVLEAISRYL